MMQPALTVAMSVYNGEAHLAEAIESILAQTFTDFEFLILNDGSTDRSQDIIDSYAVRDERIRAIHRENRGLIYSLNQLLDEARAPIIARMDDDDIALPLRFEKQMAFLEANPDHGVVGAWTYDIDETGDEYPCAFVEHPTTHEGVLEAIKDRSAILCHPAVTYRKAIVQSVGGYHRAFHHCEDYDLWLRLASVTLISNVPEKLLKYRRSPSQVSNRYALPQQIGAAVAHYAYFERAAGRHDPTADLEMLPPVDDLDSLFGQEGVGRQVRSVVVPGILYSESALKGDGLNLVVDFLKRGEHHKTSAALWKTVIRLMLMGQPRRAAKLASALLRY